MALTRVSVQSVSVCIVAWLPPHYSLAVVTSFFFFFFLLVMNNAENERIETLTKESEL